MNDLGLVFRTEFARKLRSRIFVIATLGGAIGIAALVLSPLLFTAVARTQTNAVVLAAPAAIRAHVAAALASEFDVTAQLDRLPPVVDRRFLDRHGRAAAALDVTVRDRRLHVDVWARDLSAFDIVPFRALVPYNLELATGLPEDRGRSLTRIDRTLHGVGTKFRTSGAADLGHAFAFGLIFLLYFAIVLASQTVMSAVAEEKTSRIAEILVATISPVDLLAGKTFAAAALAVVQLAVWALAALVSLPVTAIGLGGSAALLTLAPAPPAGLHGAAPTTGIVTDLLGALDLWSLLAFAAFFALGYLQYATLYAAAASLVSRTEDLGAVTTPIILPAVLAFLVAQYAVIAPESGIVVAFGFVPLVSPFVMFARIAISSVPLWQTAIALAINVAMVVASFWAAGRIYRVGMLLTGRLPTPKQILATLRG